MYVKFASIIAKFNVFIRLKKTLCPMKVKVCVGSKSFPIEIGEGECSVSTLGGLKARRTITGDDQQSLLDMNFKENDKVIVMGRAAASMKDDHGFSSLVSYEKTNLLELQKQHDKIESDLKAMELNYLDVDKSLVLVKKMEKRLLQFTECSMSHIEALDRLDIIGELTTDAQAVRNREKRKSLIDGIHDLMNKNDAHVRRLEEYKKKLLGEIIEKVLLNLGIALGMFFSPITFAVKPRTPMIKFVGARLPRPDFHKTTSDSLKTASASQDSHVKSTSSVGQTNSTFEEQLPMKYRRPPLSQEECDAINVCSFSFFIFSRWYGLFMRHFACKRYFFRRAEPTDYRTIVWRVRGACFSELFFLLQNVVNACTSRGVDEQRTFAECLEQSWTVATNPSAIFLYYISKKHSSDGNRLKNFLRAVEMCNDDFCLLVLCRIIHEIIIGNAKAQQKTHQKLIKADITSTLLRTLRYRLKDEIPRKNKKTDGTDKNITLAEQCDNTLAALILAVGTKGGALTI
ncbi:hypothetical protein DICVIV_00848 [Dictyocaulus viviparus]|uniref:BAG domain protein n=1 Tax=Dictyocaulus viviparus TaxID=29172 RepID=A0A0D8YAF1_DICVI|nr:hypothetical protein DICVIV_00848 [Dictyocaulus viviparus]